MSRLGLLSVPIVCGVVTMLTAGASPKRWAVHALAGVLGVAAYGIALAPRRTLSRSAQLGVAGAAALVIASTLLGEGIDGVRRWHDFGVLRIHPSALLAPSLLMLAAALLSSRRALVYALLLGVQVVHCAQPDAGQATAFGLGAATLVLLGPSAPRQWIVALALMSLAGCSWLRFDPLPPAPFVEDILGRAFAVAPALAIVSAAALALLPLAPNVAGRDLDPAPPQLRPARAALSLYFIGTVIAPAFGEFPVPLLGYGPSPLIGAFLGMASLARLVREAARAARDVSPSQAPSRPSEPHLCAPTPL